MSPFFPQATAEFRIEEPPAFRKFTMSIAEMAIVTGVLFRLYRALAMTVGPTTSWLYFGGTFALGVLFILGMTNVQDSVARGMEKSADWLRNGDLKSDIERQVRENPGRSLLIALGLGYVIGKAFRSSDR